MKFWPRHVRSRLTFWYVFVLASLLALYAGGAAFFLFLSLREELDRNLVQDLETVEGMLTNEPDGLVSLHSEHREGEEPRVGHFIEVWSPAGSLLYRSQALQEQTLGGPPKPGEGTHDPIPSTLRLANGSDVRVVSSVYHIEDHRVVLRVAYGEEALWRELREFGGVLLLAFPLVVLLAGLGGYTLARKALAPIDAMTNETQKISAERLNDRLSIENPDDELGKLASVLNAMLGRLQAAFDQLRRFTADASHELRTPLTVMRSVGEVALQDQAIPSEYRDVMGSMLEEVDRLTRLSESLLELSRADAGHVHLQRTDIALLTVAQEANSMVEVLAEEKGQTIDIEGDANIIVSADRLLLRQAIANLLDNAIKYSPTNSRISVQVQRGAENRAWLDITDQGPGIPVEHQSYVFDRFYRVDPARSRELGGVGLGLSITRWAVEAHDGEISLQSKEGHGATFRISLPLANYSSSIPTPGVSQK
jgi:heavy metal sensor kinase